AACVCAPVIGLLGCCGGLVLGPAAAAMGRSGRREITGQPPRYQGAGMALTGIIIGWAVSAFYFVVLVFPVLGLLGVSDPEVQRELAQATSPSWGRTDSAAGTSGPQYGERLRRAGAVDHPPPD